VVVVVAVLFVLGLVVVVLVLSDLLVGGLGHLDVVVGSLVVLKELRGLGGGWVRHGCGSCGKWQISHMPSVVCAPLLLRGKQLARGDD